MNEFELQVRRISFNRIALCGFLGTLLLFGMAIGFFGVLPVSVGAGLSMIVFYGLLLTWMVILIIQARNSYRDFTKSKAYRALGSLGLGSPEAVYQAVILEADEGAQRDKIFLTENWIWLETAFNVRIFPADRLVWVYMRARLSSSNTFMFCFSDGKKYELGMDEQLCGEILDIFMQTRPHLVIGYTKEQNRMYKSNPSLFTQGLKEGIGK